ncbi:cullin-associated NEDD8-dissociated protein 1-like isoform X3 [Grus americana]|uniref:cullin-associated NEDD8-dissociated protein 1-like isoform X3 n=1 Tax=Grus americana TaxID=9117 RepID=UPI002407DC0E|nr:cullin-associated NEDD8-dissociated protein 1-like isoform X3 [Grus americana]
MASVSYHISSLLEKMTSTDKDFRFMATNDLMMELQKDSIKLDEDSEKKVVKMLLKLLEDKNGEVQNLAVKCLGPLVGKVKEYQVETIVDTLCTNMLSDKEQLRDISSIGLKTVISELPPASTGSTMTANVCKKITAQLTGAIGKQEDVSVQLEALDILSDMLSRLGGTLYSFHSSILNCLLPQLTSPRLAVRKRAIIALGHLVLTCSGNIFSELTEHLLAELKKNESTSTTRTYIQCVAGISRQAGHRIGEHLEKIIPLIVQYCNVEDDELREYCFQAFESFVRRCPKEIDPHIPGVMGLCLKYITFDPNYNYDNEEEEEEEMMETENGEDEEQESDDEYSDDDDISWKVRRSAAKCLEAIVSSRHDLLQDFYKTLSPVLISRFKEREENVKADIFSAYISLLKQTLPIQSWLHASDAAGKDDVPLTMLRNQVPNIVKALHKQLKEKSIKSRQGCFSLLTELANVLPGCLADHIPALVPGSQSIPLLKGSEYYGPAFAFSVTIVNIKSPVIVPGPDPRTSYKPIGIVFSLADKSSSSNMRIDALSFLHVLLCNHQPEVFHPHIKSLLPPVVTCIGDPFYKITSEALLVTQQLVKVIRPLDKSCTFDAKPYVKDLFLGTLKRLKAADIDQEVKERAISCMGQIIYNLGDHLSTDLQPTLKIFLERLKNEITRLTTVKALTSIASSPLKIDLRPILGEGFPILASFLRKNQRALKLSTLTALDILVKNYSDSLKPAMIESVLTELPALITENDMHVSQVAIMFLTTLAKVYPSCISKISGSVLAEIFQLVHSPLLQGGALNAIIDFFQALVLTKTATMGYSELMKQLTAPIYSSGSAGASVTLHKQAYCSAAKCVAALSSACPKEAPTTVNQFIQEVKNPKSSSAVKVLAFLSLAEMGRTTNLSAQRELKTVILEAFSSPSEEVKSAASYALGNISVGNLKEYLPFMLKEIGSQPKRQYLLLHSLKEVISSSPADGLKPYVEDIWALLFKHCECTEEGTRNVVAECLGKLTLVNPSELLPLLKKQLSSGDFLKTLQDPDLNVRRVALAMFNSAAHNKPSLIRDLLNTVLPGLYNETKVRRELIREVEMGPFKHTVDDGLDVRKAAFECMYTLLESCLDRLDIYEYLNHVEDGLKDHYDIRMLTFIMLARLSTLCPNAVLQRLERLIEPLRATCSTKVKAGSVKQEFEKQDELKRSAMRAVAALLTIPEVEKSPAMAEFSSQIRSNPEMASLFESIQKDSASLPTTEAMDMS